MPIPNIKKGMWIHFITVIWGAADGAGRKGEGAQGEGGGGGGWGWRPLFLFGEDEIIIMKWSSIPLLLLFEGGK